MAAGILAKYYMFINDLPSAEVELKKIIDSKKDDLVANYAHLWDGLHKNSVEAVFGPQVGLGFNLLVTAGDLKQESI